MRFLVLVLTGIFFLVACQPEQPVLIMSPTPVSTASSLGYIMSAALTVTAVPPTETPVGYVPPVTLTPPYASPTPMPMFFVNGAYTTQAWPGDEIVLFWDIPGVVQVWIAQQTMGVWCPDNLTLKPDAVYGPFSPTGYQRVTIPPDQTLSLWFDLYADGNPPPECGQSARSTFLRADVSLYHVEPTSTLLPAEFFLIGTQSPRSTDEQGTLYYETAYGEFIMLNWSQMNAPVYIEVIERDSEQPVLYGPLPRTSALKVCPGDGTRYTLYAGGLPGTVAGQTISVYQSPSAFQYLPSSFVTCWQYPK